MPEFPKSSRSISLSLRPFILFPKNSEQRLVFLPATNTIFIQFHIIIRACPCRLALHAGAFIPRHLCPPPLLRHPHPPRHRTWEVPMSLQVSSPCRWARGF